MSAKMLLVASLALAPAVSLAQSALPLYVGASFNISTYNPFRSYSTNRYGPALTVGYQLSPRWAIQTGASWNRRSDNPTSIYPAGSSTVIDRVEFNLRYTRLIVPLLARYTFTNAASPLQVDALFGPSWLHSTGRTTATFVYVGGGSDSNTSTYSENSFSAGLGPSIRYAIAPHLELTANSIIQAQFADDVNRANNSFSDRLFLTTQVGVQYKFGR
jgi:hypothetical protein